MLFYLMFLMMFFSSIKEINRLISKGMSNIYYWEKLTFSKLRFSTFKKFVSTLWKAPITQLWILILLVAIYKSEVWEQNYVEFFCCFNFERNYDLPKSKSPCILLIKIRTLIKTKRSPKKKIPETFWSLSLSWNSQKQNRHFLYRFFWSKENFLTFVFYLNV